MATLSVSLRHTPGCSRGTARPLVHSSPLRPSHTPPNPAPSPHNCMAERLAQGQLHKFVAGGRTVYEWEQSLAEVNVYVPVPPGMAAREIFCDITRQHLKFGRAGNPPFLDLDLCAPVKVSECTWTLEDSVMHITLTKLQPGDTWPAVLKGHELDPVTQQQDQQRLMLERFQREHPGFDFSNATFNGQAPDASSFMGGIGSGTKLD